MRQRLLLSLLLAIAATATAAGADTSREAERDWVLAYYYPWYLQGDWSRHGYQGTPLLGKYGTDEPDVAQQHIEWARRAGLDGFVVSWWGPDHLAERHFRTGYLRAPAAGSLKFAFIYECLGRLDAADGRQDTLIDFRQPAVFARLLEDFTYLRDEYFSHPAYLRVGRRPVVVLYVTRTFRHFDAAQRASLEARLGLNLFLIADEPFFGGQRDPATARHGLRNGQPLFDAYTAYNMFENARVKPGESAYEYMRREALPIYRAWAEKTVFCPGLLPSYHDFRGNQPLGGTPAQFEAMIRDMRALPLRRVGSGVRHIYLITSFNEWWEGTTIEPAAEYGSQYLKATRRAFGR